MLPWIPPDAPAEAFPPADAALRSPNGLLAAGGDLSPERLLAAYARGIFPWYSEGEPILWWSPDPRCLFLPGRIHVSRRMQRTLRNGGYELRLDHAFGEVIAACAEPRRGQPDTWLVPEMRAAYESLHEQGHAHSIEVYQDQILSGGLYGVALGNAFFGESMFSRRRDASKVALIQLSRQLQRWGFILFDCQVASAHILRMGARLMPREEFLRLLRRALETRHPAGRWTLDHDLAHPGDLTG